MLNFCEKIHGYAMIQMLQDAKTKNIDLGKTYGVVIVLSKDTENLPHPKTDFSVEKDFWSVTYYASELMYNTYVQFLLHSPTALNKYAMKFVTKLHNEMRQALRSACNEYVNFLEAFVNQQPADRRLMMMLDGLQLLLKKFEVHHKQDFICDIILGIKRKTIIYFAKHAELLFKMKLYD